MAEVTPTVGSQAAIQGMMQQLRVQQAKRNADQAETVAQALAAKAGEARQVAARAQENARNLTVKADQASNAAGQARQGALIENSVSEMQTRLFNTVERVSERTEAEVSAAITTSPPPVLNTSGQLTGVVVNTTA